MISAVRAGELSLGIEVRFRNPAGKPA